MPRWKDGGSDCGPVQAAGLVAGPDLHDPRRRVRLRPGGGTAEDLRPAGVPDRADRLPAGDRPAITAPLGFLVGIGCFDYWFRWAIGAPTFPKEREHENHGAYSWRDYFKVNTDHKVIGIQYICTTFVFFLIGGAARDDHARRARPARNADRRPEHLQQPLLDPRRDHDLRLRDPGLRRDRQLRPAADDRRAGHGVPAAQRPELLDAADRGRALRRQLPRARAAPSTPAGPATRRSPPARR